METENGGPGTKTTESGNMGGTRVAEPKTEERMSRGGAPLLLQGPLLPQGERVGQYANCCLGS